MKHQNTHGITCSDTKITPLVSLNTNGVTPLQFDRILLNKEVQPGVWRPRLLFQYSTLSHI
nr:MAG TPA: hypothetical protein [Caudoviricetes sp.]